MNAVRKRAHRRVAAGIFLVGALLAGLCGTVCAHPVAQGSLQVVVLPEKVSVVVLSSMEEVLTSNTLASASAPASLDEAIARHGQYLASHLFISVDGTPLKGRLISSGKPERSTTPGVLHDSGMEHVRYELEFTADALARPKSVELRQNVLNEFEFAPGNAWEATYVTRISTDGAAPREGLLLDRNHPVTYDCMWDATAAPAPAVETGTMMRSYLVHGIHHILSGYDHLLFVSALVLAAASFWDLFKVVGMFTLAHTLTLLLSALNYVRLSENIVEPMIAASIVAVAVQNILSPKQSRGWTRLIAAFFFGLFHGLGFAGGLLEAMDGMQTSSILWAILAFSAGVEIGHQMVVLPLYGVLRVSRVKMDEERSRSAALTTMRYGSAMIAAAGLYYFVYAMRWAG
jgi:hydrogenase/urease accessory protein HupE